MKSRKHRRNEIEDPDALQQLVDARDLRGKVIQGVDLSRVVGLDQCELTGSIFIGCTFVSTQSEASVRELGAHIFPPLEGVPFDLDASWGFAGEVGADVMLGETWFLNVNLRYIGIETDATVGGEAFGKVKIDPWVYGAHLGFRF